MRHISGAPPNTSSTSSVRLDDTYAFKWNDTQLGKGGRRQLGCCGLRLGGKTETGWDAPLYQTPQDLQLFAYPPLGQMIWVKGVSAIERVNFEGF